MSGRLQVSVFAFALVKIVTRSSCRCASSRYVRLVTGTCFRFSARKNGNMGAANVSSMLSLPVFAFLLVKNGTSSSCRCASSRCVRLVAGTCFCFSNYKNRNMRAAAIGLPAADMSDWLQIHVFAFPLVKIVTRGQQFQVCQQQELFYPIYS